MVRVTQAKRAEMQTKFAEVDVSGDNKLDFNEMKALLQKGNSILPDAELKKLFKRIDTDGSGTIDFEEFLEFLLKEETTFVACPEKCKEKFIEFAGPEMDNSEFSRFCIGCGLLDKGFRKEDIATTFAKVLPRGQRKITLKPGPDGISQYDKLLCHLAEKKKMSPGEIHALVMMGEKTQCATKADNVRFHDDKSLYTGAHAANEAHEVVKTAKEPKPVFDVGYTTDWMHVERTYHMFEKNGKFENKDFVKLVVDSGLESKSFTHRDADVLFAKYKVKSMDFETFKLAVKEIAIKREEKVRDIQQIIGQCQGRRMSATKADEVRFHDDKSTYTGSHVGK